MVIGTREEEREGQCFYFQCCFSLVWHTLVAATRVTRGRVRRIWGPLEVFKQSLNYLRFSSMAQKMHALGKFYHSESLNPCHMSEDRKLLNTCMGLLWFSFKILSQSNNLIFIVKPCMKSECVPTSALLVLQYGWSVKSIEIFWQYFSIKKRSWHIASTS